MTNVLLNKSRRVWNSLRAVWHINRVCLYWFSLVIDTQVLQTLQMFISISTVKTSRINGRYTTWRLWFQIICQWLTLTGKFCSRVNAKQEHSNTFKKNVLSFLMFYRTMYWDCDLVTSSTPTFCIHHCFIKFCCNSPCYCSAKVSVSLFPLIQWTLHISHKRNVVTV